MLSCYADAYWHGQFSLQNLHLPSTSIRLGSSQNLHGLGRDVAGAWVGAGYEQIMNLIIWACSEGLHICKPSDTKCAWM